MTSLVAQRLKCLPAIRETWVWSLGQEDPLEKEMATHSSNLAWRIPWTEDPGGLQSMGSQRVRHDWATSVSVYIVSKASGVYWDSPEYKFLFLEVIFFFFQRVLFIYLATPHGLWDLNSPTKDWTNSPCIGRQSLIHWISGQVLEDKFWFPYWFMELGKTGQYRGSWGLRFLICKMGLISSYLVELSWETNEINISSKLPDTECV